MAQYKCEIPGCNKFFGSQAKMRQHVKRIHSQSEAEPPEEMPEVKPKLKGLETLKIKKPEQKADGYHCLDCGATFPKGTTTCPGCGEDLAWPDEESEVEA